MIGRRTLIGVVAAAAGLARVAAPHDGTACARCGPSHAIHGERPAPEPGRPRLIPHTDERAGWPRELAGHVQSSATPGGIGHYVGGDVPAFGHGHPRRASEGTWGWDETGHRWKRRRVVLGWSRGGLFQGGTGRYATDGPHVPDPIAGLANRARAWHAEGEGRGEE